MYIAEPIKKYLDDLAARRPTPGGGSAAGLSGALGAALLEMVCNFTLGNERFKDVEAEMQKNISSLEKLRKDFTALIDEDVKLYNAICTAFKTKDKKIIEDALKGGYHISLKLCRLVKDSLEIADSVADKGNKNLITDVGCGAELLEAAFKSSIFNANINLKGIGEETFVKKERLVLESLQKEIASSYKKIIEKTLERMR